MKSTLDEILEEHLPEAELTFVQERRLYGTTPTRLNLNLTSELHWAGYSLLIGDGEPMTATRLGLCQMHVSTPTTARVQLQKVAALEQGLQFLQLAAAARVQIFCFQELWTMPLGLCTGDKLPWVEFAEDPIEGETTRRLSVLAKSYEMVIISPVLELDLNGEYWNSAVVIDGTGDVVGVYRKTHIPINGNELLYFRPSNQPIPVFQTMYGRVGVSICYDRHFPTNWHALKLGGAQVVFNPCASVASFSEHLWAVEGRAAAEANHYFVASINRVGTETFQDAKGGRKVRAFYGSSYVASPSGTSTPGLSSEESGLLIVDVDLGKSEPGRSPGLETGQEQDETPEMKLYRETAQIFKQKS